MSAGAIVGRRRPPVAKRVGEVHDEPARRSGDARGLSVAVHLAARRVDVGGRHRQRRRRAEHVVAIERDAELVVAGAGQTKGGGERRHLVVVGGLGAGSRTTRPATPPPGASPSAATRATTHSKRVCVCRRRRPPSSCSASVCVCGTPATAESGGAGVTRLTSSARSTAGPRRRWRDADERAEFAAAAAAGTTSALKGEPQRRAAEEDVEVVAAADPRRPRREDAAVGQRLERLLLDARRPRHREGERAQRGAPGVVSGSPARVAAEHDEGRRAARDAQLAALADGDRRARAHACGGATAGVCARLPALPVVRAARPTQAAQFAPPTRRGALLTVAG